MIYFLLIVLIIWQGHSRRTLKRQLTEVILDKEFYWNRYFDLKEEKEEKLYEKYKDKYKWGEVDSDDPCSFCKAFDECSKDNNLLVYCQKTYFNCCILKIKY